MKITVRRLVCAMAPTRTCWVVRCPACHNPDGGVHFNRWQHSQALSHANRHADWHRQQKGNR